MGDDSRTDPGAPKVSDATIDELVDWYGVDQVQRMFDLRILSDTQGRAWQSRIARDSPEFGEPVPEV